MLASAFLIVVMGLQFMIPSSDAPVQTIGLAARRPRPVSIPPLPEYPAILRVPLFAPDRRPGQAAAANATAGGSLSGYAVLGAVSGRTVATAVISGPSVNARTIRRGELLDGWRLAAVDRGKVIFERNGVTHIMIVGAPPEGVASPSPTPAPQPANP